jgi:hypothetical protein
MAASGGYRSYANERLPVVLGAIGFALLAAVLHRQHDSEVPSPLRRTDDPRIVVPLVRVGEEHFVARHRVGGLQ